MVFLRFFAFATGLLVQAHLSTLVVAEVLHLVLFSFALVLFIALVALFPGLPLELLFLYGLDLDIVERHAGLIILVELIGPVGVGLPLRSDIRWLLWTRLDLAVRFTLLGLLGLLRWCRGLWLALFRRRWRRLIEEVSRELPGRMWLRCGRWRSRSGLRSWLRHWLCLDRRRRLNRLRRCHLLLLFLSICLRTLCLLLRRFYLLFLLFLRDLLFLLLHFF